MSKRAEVAALKAYPNVGQPVWDKSYPKILFVRHTERNAFIKGYEQAEKELTPLINRLCKAILLGEDAADLASKILIQINGREK